MAKKAYQKPTIDIEEAVNHINRYSLPYGLCKGAGIDTDGMTPREAWEAWENKTGKTKAQAEKEHWGEDKGKEKKKEKDREEPKKPKELSDFSDTYNAPKWANSEETKKKIADAIDYVYSKYDLTKLKSVNVRYMKRAFASANHSTLNIASSFLLDPNGEAARGKRVFDSNMEFRIKRLEKNIADESDEEIKKYYQKRLEKIKNGFKRFNVIYPDDALKSVVVHELGHTLSAQYFGLITGGDSTVVKHGKVSASSARQKIAEAYFTCLKNGEIYSISEYAQQNVNEFFAESFAMKEMGREELPPTVKKLFEEIL